MIRVGFKPDGEVYFDTDTTDEAISIARKLEANPLGVPVKTPKAKKPPADYQTEVTLTGVQHQTWKALVQVKKELPIFDVTYLKVALNLTQKAAQVRIHTLMKLGLVERVRRGQYQLVDG